MRISDWSSDVCSSDLLDLGHHNTPQLVGRTVIKWGRRSASSSRPTVVNRRSETRSQCYCHLPMTMTPRRPAPRLLTALITATLACAAGAPQDVRLPDLGSSANALISPQEAQNYGASMPRQLRALAMV